MKHEKEVIEQFREKHGDKYLYDKVEYVNSKIKVLIGCKVKGHGYFECTPSNHLKGKGCPICSGKRVVKELNSIFKLRPDLIEYFVDVRDAETNTVGSGKKVKLVCPRCKKIKNNLIQICNLSSYGFSCDYCSDGIPIPEKFGIYLFKYLNINFKTQKSFDWSDKKRYDFYIPVKNVIVEVHGMQHYADSFKRGGLKNIQENDLYKYNLAIENGIKPENYIVIDCRYSELYWLRENYEQKLNKIIDCTQINWNDIWESCQCSLLIKMCNDWNMLYPNITTIEIGKMYNVGRATATKWLMRGAEIGICNYNKKEVRISATKKMGMVNRKTTYQYSTSNIFIKKWDSGMDVCRELGIASSSMSGASRGKIKTAGGFKWSYNPPNEHNQYPD